jgi:hypothetical protein
LHPKKAARPDSARFHDDELVGIYPLLAGESGRPVVVTARSARFIDDQ